MIAVVGGLLTALVWAIATLCAARASRAIGAWSTTSWVVLIGLLATIPLLAMDRLPGPADAADLSWLAVTGLGYVAGMVLNYSALAGGKVPVAAPIASAEGAIAAVLAVITGEAAGAPLLILLAVVAGGIVLTTLEPGGGIDVPSGGRRLYVVFAMGAALSFGISLYAAGRASGTVPLGWVVAAGRVAGVALVALPMMLSRRLRFERSVAVFLLIPGLLEVVGFLTFAWGARESIAVTAVLSSQFAVLAAVGAHLLGERIAPRQWLGVVVVASAVTLITLLQL